MICYVLLWFAIACHVLQAQEVTHLSTNRVNQMRWLVNLFQQAVFCGNVKLYAVEHRLVEAVLLAEIGQFGSLRKVIRLPFSRQAPIVGFWFVAVVDKLIVID